MEFAKALHIKGKRNDGYIEDDENIVTWCVGHLIGMSYPEAYDPELKKWDLETIPFLPPQDAYKYEVMAATKKQYGVVKTLLNRKDVGCIYYAGDSAREGEYIQRLVREKAGRNKNAEEKRVWIDSQTEEEILRGIREAKPLSEYDTLSDSAYARAIEDYGIGINFSRALSVKYANLVCSTAGVKWGPIAVGRVMSCVLGMVVDREREIRNHVKTKYYTVTATVKEDIEASWKAKDKSSFYKDDDVYNKNGFLDKAKAEAFVNAIGNDLILRKLTFQATKKAAPLLFNLAELQGECTKRFHISPDTTLQIAQELYEKKLTTYPRTDARVLTTAIDKVIDKNIRGLRGIQELTGYSDEIIRSGAWKHIASTKYTNDSAVSDHYAIIPTGETGAFAGLGDLQKQVYILIARRFLSIFYPQAQYNKMTAVFEASGETFTASYEDLQDAGWMHAADKVPDTAAAHKAIEAAKTMRQGDTYPGTYTIKDAETKPPARYTTGSMVLAMENAGKLIEDEELREQIKGSGIGTSATRAETIKKLISNRYLKSDKKEVLSPTLLGEAIYEILYLNAKQLLSPTITASWEKGLAGIVSGSVTRKQYLDKMYDFIRKMTEEIKAGSSGTEYSERMKAVLPYYGKDEDAAKAAEIATEGGSKRPAGESTGFTCPVCQRPVIRRANGPYACEGYPKECDFILWNKWCGKALTDTHMKALMSGKTTSEIKGFTSKAGKTFSAKLKLENNKIVPVWK